MRGISGTLVILFITGYVASTVELPRAWSNAASAKVEVADGWRRTATGWEWDEVWLRPQASFEQPPLAWRIHPFTCCRTAGARLPVRTGLDRSDPCQENVCTLSGSSRIERRAAFGIRGRVQRHGLAAGRTRPFRVVVACRCLQMTLVPPVRRTLQPSSHPPHHLRHDLRSMEIADAFGQPREGMGHQDACPGRGFHVAPKQTFSASARWHKTKCGAGRALSGNHANLLRASSDSQRRWNIKPRSTSEKSAPTSPAETTDTQQGLSPIHACRQGRRDNMLAIVLAASLPSDALGVLPPTP